MNNPPAFPQFGCSEHNDSGMTLRDYFAAHCMADVLTTTNWTPENIAKAAKIVWELADAMLKAREQ